MRNDMIALVICLSVALTAGWYKSMDLLSVVHATIDLPGDQMGKAASAILQTASNSFLPFPAAQSLRKHTSGITVKVAAATGMDEQAEEEEEGGEDQNKGDKDDDKDQGGPDRLWDAGKLG